MVTPWKLLVGLLLMAVAAVIFMALKRSTPPAATEGTQSSINAKLRLTALSWKPEDVGITVPDTPAGVWGTVTDMRTSRGASATIVAMADGSASIYWGEAGGIIGGQGQESVREAAKQAVAAMEICAPAMKKRGIQPLPQADRARLYAHSRSGLLSSDELDLKTLAELYKAGDPLARCYRAVDEVTTQLLRVSKRHP